MGVITTPLSGLVVRWYSWISEQVIHGVSSVGSVWTKVTPEGVPFSSLSCPKTAHVLAWAQPHKNFTGIIFRSLAGALKNHEIYSPSKICTHTVLLLVYSPAEQHCITASYLWLVHSESVATVAVHSPKEQKEDGQLMLVNTASLLLVMDPIELSSTPPVQNIAMGKLCVNATTTRLCHLNNLVVYMQLSKCHQPGWNRESCTPMPTVPSHTPPQHH